MGIAMISPVLPELRVVFDVTDAQVGLVITAYTLPGIFLTPFIGVLADRVGRKRVLVPLLFTFGISGIAMAFTTSFAVLLGLRLVQGVGASALVMLAITIIGDLYEGSTRRTLIGLNSTMLGSGAAFFPVIGGGLAVIYWGLPFAFFGVGILVGLVAVFVLEESGDGEVMDTRAYVTLMLEVTRTPKALGVFLAIFGIFFIHFGAVVTALPLLMNDGFGLSSGEIGLVLAMVAVSSAFVSSQFGRLSEWRTPQQLIGLGFLIFGASLFVVWLAPNPYIIGGGLLGFGVGLGTVMPAVETLIVTLVSDDLRAGIMGLRTSMLRLGQTLGPFAYTFSAQTFFVTTVDGYYVLLFASGIVFVGVGSGIYLLVRS